MCLIARLLLRYRTASGSERDKNSTFLYVDIYEQSQDPGLISLTCFFIPLATARGSVTLLSSLFSLSKNRRPYAHDRGPFFDRDFEIVSHTH